MTRFGINGGPATLEEIGQIEGVTRERIRQLMVAFEKRAVGWWPPLISLAILQGAIDAAGEIVTTSELQALMPAPLQLADADFGALRGLASLTWIRGLEDSPHTNVWTRWGADKASAREKMAKVRHMVTASVRRFGAIDLSAFEAVAPEDGAGLAMAAFAERGPYHFVDGWVVLRSPQRTALANRIHKISHATTTLPMHRLRRALKRAFRITIPESVLTALIERDLPLAKVSDGQFSWPANMGRPLSRTEALALAVVEDAGGAISLRELQRQFVTRGMSAGSAGVAWSRSVILERVAPGVHAAIGTSPDASIVARVRRELKQDSSRALIGMRHHADGIELLYKLDPHLISSTLFLVPKKAIQRGQWRVAGSNARLAVKGTYIVGLHGWARRFLQGGSRQLSVSFNPSTQVARISAR